jgi:hypothetical protein
MLEITKSFHALTVIERTAVKHQSNSDDECDEDDMTEREHMTNRDVRICIAELQLHFTQKDNEGILYLHRNLC